MNTHEYKELYDRLETHDDIERLAEARGLDPELLLVIHTQRVTRDATRRYYKVKRNVRRMLYQWRKGTSLGQLASSVHFPATLVAQMILLESGVNRKDFWKYLRDPKKTQDQRLRRELEQIADLDPIYSPQGTEVQNERGRVGEARLNSWLDDQGIEYRTEEEIRDKYPKTPDALLRKPMVYNGVKKFWIESKGTFGDTIEVRRHLKRQLNPYVDLFGAGLVVYWFGFVDDLKLDVPDGVDMVDASFFATPEVII
jgi:hypothetical protein